MSFGALGLTAALLLQSSCSSGVKVDQPSACWRTDAFRVRLSGQVLTLPKTVQPSLSYLNLSKLAYVNLPGQPFSVCQRKNSVPLDVGHVELKALRLLDQNGSERHASATLSTISSERPPVSYSSLIWSSARTGLRADGIRVSCSDPPASKAIRTCEVSPMFLGNIRVALFISGTGQSQTSTRALLKSFDDQLFSWGHYHD
jgi:hypothetical protein